MTRIALALVAFGWVAVGVGAWVASRRNGSRRAPTRWHHAVDTLRGWADDDGLPVAATWCRPLVQPVLVRSDLPRDLPRQRPEGQPDRDQSAVG